MISLEIKTKTPSISYNSRPINQYSYGMAAMHRQEEEEILFCDSNSCMHNTHLCVPLIFYLVRSRLCYNVASVVCRRLYSVVYEMYYG